MEKWPSQFWMISYLFMRTFLVWQRRDLTKLYCLYPAILYSLMLSSSLWFSWFVFLISPLRVPTQQFNTRSVLITLSVFQLAFLLPRALGLFLLGWVIDLVVRHRLARATINVLVIVQVEEIAFVGGVVPYSESLSWWGLILDIIYSKLWLIRFNSLKIGSMSSFIRVSR